MSTEPYPSRLRNQNQIHRSFGRRIIQKFKGLFSLQHEPEDREDIHEILNLANKRAIIDDHTLKMMIGSISFSEMMANDIMVSRSKMDVIDINRPLPDIVRYINETSHSRFPVFDGDRDNIIGILLAKDLLRYFNTKNQVIRGLIRPALFVPETILLGKLLQEFKSTRNHIAIVVDEYGSITGLVTMEDVLEQIVGDIEDEFDEEVEQTFFAETDHSWRVKGTSEIKHLNEILGCDLPDDNYETLGGLLASELDEIPKRNDIYQYKDLKFKVLKADEKQALWIHVRRVPILHESDSDVLENS